MCCQSRLFMLHSFRMVYCSGNLLFMRLKAVHLVLGTMEHLCARIRVTWKGKNDGGGRKRGHLGKDIWRLSHCWAPLCLRLSHHARGYVRRTLCTQMSLSFMPCHHVFPISTGWSINHVAGELQTKQAPEVNPPALVIVRRYWPLGHQIQDLCQYIYTGLHFSTSVF